MSYEIVKGIKIDKEKGTVSIKSASNNVSPRHFHWWRCEPLEEILKHKGVAEVEKHILNEYWEGNFKGTENNYQKSAYFTRQKHGWDDPILKDELLEVLYANYQAFKKRKFGRFIVDLGDGKYYLKVTKNYTYSTFSKPEARIFRSKEDAEYEISKRSRPSYSIVDIGRAA